MVDLGNVADWGAVVVAVSAAVVAVWSHRSARRSAVAAEETLRLSQTPEFTAEVENPSGTAGGTHGWHRLMVRVAKSVAGPIDELHVELLTDGVAFSPSQNGVEPGAPRFVAVHADDERTPASLDVGDRAHWRLVFDDEYDQLPGPAFEQIEIRVTATRRDTKPWTTVLHVPVEARRKANAVAALDQQAERTVGSRYARRRPEL